MSETDIVERLRADKPVTQFTQGGNLVTFDATPSKLELEAADEITRLRAESQWRTIETADTGDEFLVWNGCHNVAYFNGGDWVHHGEGIDPSPTHWLPLPSPPKGDGQ